MRKLMGLGVAIALMIGASATSSMAQIIVKVRPPRPAVVVTRPAAPGPGYVWVDEDWVGRGNNYDWHGGYWAAPPRAGIRWVPGHWVQRRRGWVWMPGHWNERGRGRRF